ncbi:MAG: hypothetical protein RMJ44_05515 [Cytophagales bacterium]|nr:hypothetical protein [Bernardetiaceae bacterium]MDW8210525.1 hypothetical protein [Cytophagales bacterium]
MMTVKMQPNWFVALPVRQTEELLKQLAMSAPSAMRLFDAADTHLTIAFMGAMPASLASNVLEVMRQIYFEPFIISLKKLVPLPSIQRPSAFSFTLDKGNEQASAIIERWRDALTAAGKASFDRRPPLPHLTIGRLQRKHRVEEVRTCLQWVSQLPQIPFETLIDSIALYTWSEDRRRRQFKIVEEYIMS